MGSDWASSRSRSIESSPLCRVNLRRFTFLEAWRSCSANFSVCVVPTEILVPSLHHGNLPLVKALYRQTRSDQPASDLHDHCYQVDFQHLVSQSHSSDQHKLPPGTTHREHGSRGLPPRPVPAVIPPRYRYSDFDCFSLSRDDFRLSSSICESDKEAVCHRQVFLALVSYGGTHAYRVCRIQDDVLICIAMVREI